MGTALAVTQQQSIELADPRWARIHNTDRCPRCSGLMVAEWCQDLSDYTAQRCVQCGEIIDPVILQQPREHPARTDDHAACRENVGEQLPDERIDREVAPRIPRRFPLGWIGPLSTPRRGLSAR